MLPLSKKNSRPCLAFRSCTLAVMVALVFGILQGIGLFTAYSGKTNQMISSGCMDERTNSSAFRENVPTDRKQNKILDNSVLASLIGSNATSGDVIETALMKKQEAPLVFDGVKSKAFDPWPTDIALPCYPSEDDWKKLGNAPAEEGFIFVKPYKTGSSTCSGVNLRIARNVARRQNKEFNMCKSRFDHTWANRKYAGRIPEKTFLWSIVREPTSRVVSQFYHFEVSRDKVEPSDENFINYTRNGPQNMIHDYYLASLSLQAYRRGESNAVDIANKILEDYNFIGKFR